jgi:hypothetical protein
MRHSGLTGLAIAVCLLARDSTGPALAPALWDRLAGQIRPGDIVLAGYPYSPWAMGAALTSLPENGFGHAGVAVTTPDGLRIVHASGNPVHEQSRAREDTLAHFLKGAERIGIYRAHAPHLPPAMARAARRLAARRPAFDADFSLATTDRVYCTELVWQVMHSALGHDPFPVKPQLLARPVITLAMLETAPMLRPIARQQLSAGNGT